MNSDHVYNLLKEKFSHPEYAIFPEVADSTGSHCSRYADAIAMSLWPSRGLDVIGFEIKVSRSDLVSELKNPKKSVAVQSYCDKWYLVLASEDLIKEGELPSAWGLIVVNKLGKLQVLKSAPQLEAQPLKKSFIASILRRAYEFREREKQNIVSSSQRDMMDELHSLRDKLREFRGLTEKFDIFKSAVSMFKKATGQEFNEHSVAELGHALSLLKAKKYIPNLTHILKNLSDSLEGHKNRIESYLDCLKETEDSHESI